MDLSIVVITKNNRTGLLKTINSIYNQKNKNEIDFEVIVIDSLSTDESKFAVDNLYLKNINYIYERDNGIYDALNKGIELSVGDYIWFLNAGDYIVGEILSEISIMPTYLNRVYKNKLGFNSRFKQKIWYGMPTSHQAIIYKNSFLKYNTNYRLCADYLFTIHHSITDKFVCQDTSGYIYYDTTGVSNKKYILMLFEKNKINLRYFPLYYPFVFFIDLLKLLFYIVKLVFTF
jgi:glycosyltransferase involved in cell wall biosynthesis